MTKKKQPVFELTDFYALKLFPGGWALCHIGTDGTLIASLGQDGFLHLDPQRLAIGDRLWVDDYGTPRAYVIVGRDWFLDGQVLWRLEMDA